MICIEYVLNKLYILRYLVVLHRCIAMVVQASRKKRYRVIFFQIQHTEMDASNTSVQGCLVNDFNRLV